MTQEHERLLVTYSPLLSNVLVDKLETALRGEMVFVEGKMCSIGDIRVDEKARKIYGIVREIETFGEYK